MRAPPSPHAPHHTAPSPPLKSLSTNRAPPAVPGAPATHRRLATMVCKYIASVRTLGNQHTFPRSDTRAHTPRGRRRCPPPYHPPHAARSPPLPPTITIRPPAAAPIFRPPAKGRVGSRHPPTPSLCFPTWPTHAPSRRADRSLRPHSPSSTHHQSSTSPPLFNKASSRIL